MNLFSSSYNTPARTRSPLGNPSNRVWPAVPLCYGVLGGESTADPWGPCLPPGRAHGGAHSAARKWGALSDSTRYWAVLSPKLVCFMDP